MLITAYVASIDSIFIWFVLLIQVSSPVSAFHPELPQSGCTITTQNPVYIVYADHPANKGDSTTPGWMLVCFLLSHYCDIS